MKDIWAELRAPFMPDDIEWRVQQGAIGRDGKPWAKVLAYVTNRAIQERLDEIVGPDNWQNEFRVTPGGTICRLGVRVKRDDKSFEWVWKEDGSDESDIEAFKGGLSGAMKRAASTGFGIGRYLYRLPPGWAVFREDGRYSAPLKKNPKDKNESPQWFKWEPPELPKWALPDVITLTGNETATPPVVTIPSERKEEGVLDMSPEAVERRRTLMTDINNELKWQESHGGITTAQKAALFGKAQEIADDEDRLKAMLNLTREAEGIKAMIARIEGRTHAHTG